jgi:predicted flap endonuclease-1-like 5' DNA nuclease
MIWHFLEVWVLMLAAFAIGCPIGAATYTLIARSPLAELQGRLADVVGDIVDGIKSRLGIGPVWRPEYRRLVERASSGAEGASGSAQFSVVLDHSPADDSSGRLSAGAVPMIADLRESVPGVGVGAAASVGRVEDGAVARPMALANARNRVPDDLQRIRGIGRRVERRLNALGIFHFGQIAAWTPAETRWVARELGFPERIDQEDWVGQAIVLAAGGSTGFVKSVDRRRARRRQVVERQFDAIEPAELERVSKTAPSAEPAAAESPVRADKADTEGETA